MNIAVIDMDNLKNPFWGAGQARATREVCKLLAKRHQVTVYSAKYPGWKDYVEDGIHYTHVGLESSSPRLTNLLFAFSVPFFGSRIKADIIVENFNAPFSVSFLPLFTKIPVVALPTMFNAIEFTKKYHLPFHWVEKVGLKTYKYMLPYSNVDSSKAKRLNPNIQFKIVPQGVGEEFFKIKQLKPEYILFLGRFDNHQKGVDLLLQAYNKVKDVIEYPLVLAGHGPDEPIIRRMIDELHLGDKVTIVGPAYGDKKTTLLQKALFTAFPSRHDEMSLWSLESLASGLPLVGFDLPECGWAPKSVYLKAKPFELDEYAQLLVQATKPEVIQPLRKEARKFASQFTWDFVASEFEDFFDKVIRQNLNKERGL
ncbi:glycosyltransferase family 4 protein [Patescibacteria group bacterium]|nr:glycosyltransferase family 4 protein [Patescibacteria group bacterium]